MATEILRPNAAGDETSINTQSPDSTYHWDKVDEESADDWITWISNKEVASYQRDLYNLPASVGSGTINFIKIHFRVRYRWFEGFGVAKPSLKSNDTITDGTEINLTETFTTHSQQWNINPADGQPWEWADIDALQIGVSLKNNGTTWDYEAACTQVYVEVDYEPAIAVGRSSGYIIG